jgi:hypothetical protein
MPMTSSIFSGDYLAKKHICKIVNRPSRHVQLAESTATVSHMYLQGTLTEGEGSVQLTS